MGIQHVYLHKNHNKQNEQDEITGVFKIYEDRCLLAFGVSSLTSEVGGNARFA
jgi:hypothetical protein